MYIAMNRFKILKGKESVFEEIWRTRDSHLDDVDGFIKFNLIKGEESDNFIIYVSHSTWKSEDHFRNWTKSESFRKAHKNTGDHRGVYLSHPVFEGYNVVI